jgi:hypothetical protein
MGVRAGRWCVPLLCEQCGFVGSAVRTGFVGSAVRTRFVGSAVRTRFVGSAVRTRIEESHADPQRSQRPQREEGVSEPVPRGPPPACRQTGADRFRRVRCADQDRRISRRSTEITETTERRGRIGAGSAGSAACLSADRCGPETCWRGARGAAGLPADVSAGDRCNAGVSPGLGSAVHASGCPSQGGPSCVPAGTQRTQPGVSTLGMRHDAIHESRRDG